ncbi:MAG: hypothetical protein AB1832_03380 [Pseudomonadota bacterium]
MVIALIEMPDAKGLREGDPAKLNECFFRALAALNFDGAIRTNRSYRRDGDKRRARTPDR